MSATASSTTSRTYAKTAAALLTWLAVVGWMLLAAGAVTFWLLYANVLTI